MFVSFLQLNEILIRTLLTCTFFPLIHHIIIFLRSANLFLVDLKNQNLAIRVLFLPKTKTHANVVVLSPIP
ncbi:hypothetical protein RJT34_18905 [Clitoria ternatea]|uniref:Uncharacterized protein n=1 Tax=Clitoria ternatea TaxID=43366 RepID=A0AAN9P3V3_CLITE